MFINNKPVFNSEMLSFRFRMVWLLLPFLFMTSAVFAGGDGLEQRDIVFYYGSRPPVEDLRHFDQIVIQPSQILPHEKTALLNLDSLDIRLCFVWRDCAQ